MGDVYELVGLGGKVGLERKAGHIEDRIHRRADLMAHVRQKRAFGLVGFLGRGRRALQLGGALRHRLLQLIAMPGERLILFANLEQQLRSRAPLDPLPLLGDEVRTRLKPAVTQAPGHANAPVVGRRHLVEYRVEHRVTIEARAGLERQHQTWGVAARLDADGDARLAREPHHAAALGRSRDGDPCRRDRVDLERQRETTQLVARFHQRRVVSNPDDAKLDHRWYRSTTHDASSCDLPNRWTIVAATIRGRSV